MTFYAQIRGSFTMMQWMELLLRIVAAAVCGWLVGVERSRRLKDAGVRTHSMVACATALLMISPIRMFSLKFKGFGWKENEIRYLFWLVCGALLAGLRAYGIPAIVVCYVLISTLRWLFVRTGDK